MAKSIIIGGGVGGLAAAMQLAKKGIEVDLIDPNLELGGKIHQTNFRRSKNGAVRVRRWILTVPFCTASNFRCGIFATQKTKTNTTN